MVFQILKTTLLPSFLHFVSASHEDCLNTNSQSSCSACFKADPDCVWSTEPHLFKSETPCFAYSETDNDKIVEDRTRTRELVSSSENTHISPEEFSIRIRPGDITPSIQLDFDTTASNYLDVYFLVDLSLSLEQDIKNIGNSMKSIAKTLRSKMKKNEVLRMGVGSFQDKPTTPFLENKEKTTNSHVFKNWATIQQVNPEDERDQVLTRLTQIFESFQEHLLANNDANEAGFEALVQVAACEEIGWDEKSRHMVIYVTSDMAHLQGMGHFAGINVPNSMKCHLRETGGDVMIGQPMHTYSAGLTQDHPSLDSLKVLLQQSDIQVAFMPTREKTNLDENILKFYQNVISVLGNQHFTGLFNNELGEFIGESVIETAYDDMTDKIQLISNEKSVLQNTGFFIESIDTTCDGTIREYCDKSSKNVRFNIKFGLKQLKSDLDTCSDPTTLQLSVPGFGGSEIVKINLESICSCDSQNSVCQKSIQDSICADNCSGNGKMDCGKCLCDEGFTGECCECSDEESEELKSQCIERKSGKICSNKGECQCGKCICGNSYGYFDSENPKCECDVSKCPKHNGQVCGGPDHGECDVARCDNTCKCKKGWLGSKCQCPSSECETDFGICGGQGRCRCESSYAPKSVYDTSKSSYCMCRKQYESENEETAVWNLDPETRCKELVIECSRLDLILNQYPNGQVSNIPRDFEFQNSNRSNCDNRDLLCVGCLEGCKRTYEEWSFYLDFSGKNPELKYKVVDKRCNNEVDTMRVFFVTLIITLVLGALVILLMRIIIVWLDKKEDSRHEHEVKTVKSKVIRGETIKQYNDTTTRRTSTLFSESSGPLIQQEGTFYTSQTGGHQTKGGGYY